MITHLTNTLNANQIILIIICACLLIGIIIFFLSGITVIGDKKAIITEKAGKKSRELHKGFHYLVPLVEIKVGEYNLDIQTAKANFTSFSIVLKYKIVDPSKYHYAGHDYTIKLSALLVDVKSNEEITEIISNISNQYGVEPINVEITQL